MIDFTKESFIIKLWKCRNGDRVGLGVDDMQWNLDEAGKEGWGEDSIRKIL